MVLSHVVQRWQLAGLLRVSGEPLTLRNFLSSCLGNLPPIRASSKTRAFLLLAHLISTESHIDSYCPRRSTHMCTSQTRTQTCCFLATPIWPCFLALGSVSLLFKVWSCAQQPRQPLSLLEIRSPSPPRRPADLESVFEHGPCCFMCAALSLLGNLFFHARGSWMLPALFGPTLRACNVVVA